MRARKLRPFSVLSLVTLFKLRHINSTLRHKLLQITSAERELIGERISQQAIAQLIGDPRYLRV